MLKEISAKPKHVYPNYVGPKRGLDTITKIISYNTQGVYDVDPSVSKSTKVEWLIVQGLEDAEQIIELSKGFSIGTSALCDVLNIPERPHLINCDAGVAV